MLKIKKEGIKNYFNMIKLQDTIIQSDTQSVLDMLKFDLAKHGVDRFHQFRRNGDRKEYNND